MEALPVRDRLAASMGQKVDQLSKQMQALTTNADELVQKQTALDGLQESLGQVDELAKRTAWQYENSQAEPPGSRLAAQGNSRLL